MRAFSFLDQVIDHMDQVVRTLGNGVSAMRPNPAAQIEESDLSAKEKRHIAGLMRVNHAGEIAAQALYQGQALTAATNDVKENMQQCADEEVDHLAWCQQRLAELSSHTSYLGPLWYLGALCIGVAAGIAGDKWSLGFVVETEHQVMRHLQRHLEQVPKKDEKTHAIIQQMHKDEASHASKATDSGAALLPFPIKRLMNLTAKIMTKTAYWV